MSCLGIVHEIYAGEKNVLHSDWLNSLTFWALTSAT